MRMEPQPFRVFHLWSDMLCYMRHCRWEAINFIFQTKLLFRRGEWGVWMETNQKRNKHRQAEENERQKMKTSKKKQSDLVRREKMTECESFSLLLWWHFINLFLFLSWGPFNLSAVISHTSGICLRLLKKEEFSTTTGFKRLIKYLSIFSIHIPGRSNISRVWQMSFTSSSASWGIPRCSKPRWDI